VLNIDAMGRRWWSDNALGERVQCELEKREREEG
jgi:hypothetical protein